MKCLYLGVKSCWRCGLNTECILEIWENAGVFKTERSVKCLINSVVFSDGMGIENFHLYRNSLFEYLKKEKPEYYFLVQKILLLEG